MKDGILQLNVMLQWYQILLFMSRVLFSYATYIGKICNETIYVLQNNLTTMHLGLSNLCVTRVSEAKLREAYISKEDDADIVQQKLQEAQHKQVNLKEQLNEARREKHSEIDNLELKLGAAEHKISQLEDVLRNKDLGNWQQGMRKK